MTRTPSLSLAEAAAQAATQPSADEIRSGIQGLDNRLHGNENSQQGPRHRTPPKVRGGRKDNAPPTMLRRGQNR